MNERDTQTVERVAKAIAYSGIVKERGGWDNFLPETQQHYKLQARVAISAMPDTTDLIEAADKLSDEADNAINNAERIGDYVDPIVSMPLSVLHGLNKALKEYRKAKDTA